MTSITSEAGPTWTRGLSPPWPCVRSQEQRHRLVSQGLRPELRDNSKDVVTKACLTFGAWLDHPLQVPAALAAPTTQNHTTEGSAELDCDCIERSRGKQSPQRANEWFGRAAMSRHGQRRQSSLDHRARPGKLPPFIDKAVRHRHTQRIDLFCPQYPTDAGGVFGGHVQPAQARPCSAPWHPSPRNRSRGTRVWVVEEIGEARHGRGPRGDRAGGWPCR